MAGDELLSILRMFHFPNNEDHTEGDRLHKVCSLFDKFLTVLQDTFTPFQDLCVEEDVVLFKGRLNFKQYMKTKNEIQLYLLYDCETVYVSNFQTYTGEDKH
jgi:hypothetical protein